MRFRSRDRPLRCGRIARREDDLLCEWDPERGAWRGAFDFPDGAVRGVALSPDGRSVAFGRADGTARVAWVEDGTVRCDLEGHGGAVERCVRGRDGVTLYTVSNDGTLRGWDVARGVERLRAEIPREMYGEPCSCVLSEDGDVLTLAVGDSVVTYDLVRDRWGEPWGVGYSAFLQALRVGARGVQCHVHGDDASDPDQHMIAWLDLTQRTVSGEFSEPELQWLCANGRLFPGGSRAVVLARERDTRPDDTREASAIVDLDTGELLHLARRGPAFDDVTVVCAAVGARWVAAGYESEPRVTLWDARTGVLLPPIELPRFEHATAIALCEARAEVLVGTHGGRVLRYRLDGV
jgi:WD40 repeat protein